MLYVDMKLTDSEGKCSQLRESNVKLDMMVNAGEVWETHLEIQKDESGYDHEYVTLTLKCGDDRIEICSIGYNEIGEFSDSLAKQIQELI